MLALAGWGRQAGPAWKPTSLVDAAIQGKINNTFTFTSLSVAQDEQPLIEALYGEDTLYVCIKWNA